MVTHRILHRFIHKHARRNYDDFRVISTFANGPIESIHRSDDTPGLRHSICCARRGVGVSRRVQFDEQICPFP